jgi:predicted porin
VAAKPAAPAKGGIFKNTPLDWYGNLDLSVDYATKGIPSIASTYPTPPVGALGWQPSVVTNNSYFGLRGTHAIDPTLDLVFQLEAGVQVSAIPGTVNNNASTDTSVNGALFSRNNFLGLKRADWGAIKIGRIDAPYKASTARMNPFAGTVGDYASIVGNTGGDNRVEFGTRLDHAIWYESPVIGGFKFVALVSPGQNRGIDNDIQATGEPDCTGGNALNNIFQPGGPSRPGTGCNDGAFGTAWSTSLTFEQGPWYATLAYELHKDVNRDSDQYATNFGNDNSGAGNSSNWNFAGMGPATDWNPLGVANEDAFKAGVQYAFTSGTSASFIWERFTRNMAADLQRFNERQREGFWLALTQPLTSKDQLNVGWGHAGRTPGDPGASFASVDPAGQGGPGDDAANLVAFSYRHSFDPQTVWYAVYARQANHATAHYDLGGGGTSGLTVDCHDGVSIVGANCYEGNTLQALQFGLDYKF